MTVTAIIEIVQQLKEQTGECDPYRMAGALGVHIFPRIINHCSGFFFTVDGLPIIVLNCALPEIIQRIICAHELGHAMLHADTVPLGFQFNDLFILTREASGKEYEANVFAAELLLEDDDVIENLHSGLNFYQAAAALGVPADLLAFKLKVMQKKGYDIPELPQTTDSSFLKNVSVPEEELYE